MDDITEALRELGQRIDLEDPPSFRMDHGIRTRIRRRQAWAAVMSVALAGVVAGGVWASVRFAHSPATTGQSPVTRTAADGEARSPKAPDPTAGKLATISVDGYEFYYEVVQIDGVDRLRVSSQSGDQGVFDFPPADSLVATSFSTAAETEMGVGGIVTNAAAHVFVEMSDGRSIKAELIALPPSISDSYLLFVAQVQAPLTDYDVVGTDSQGGEVVRRHYLAPRVP